MATLGKDGSPRISGTEATFADGDLWLGAVHQSLKPSTCAATRGSPSTARPRSVQRRYSARG